MIETVRRSAQQFVPAGTRVAVALSGGVDSIVLLHVLAALRDKLAFSLDAIHVNHGLSVHSSAWESACGDVCASLGVSYAALRLRLERRPGESLEACARDARYGALEAELLARGIRVAAIAHHADDQAETVLLQLLRGAAARGLSAMSSWRCIPSGICYWRPLLSVHRTDIISHAQQAGLRWIEDESNEDRRLKRNYLRAEVFPRLAIAFPGYRTSLARAASHAADTAALLDQLGDADAGWMEPDQTLLLQSLRALGRPRAENVLRRLLLRRGRSVPPVERLREFVRQAFDAAPDRHPSLRIGATHVLRAEAGRISLDASISTAPYRAGWLGEPLLELPHGSLLFVRGEGVGIRALAIPDSGLIVRTRQGGERMSLARSRPRRSVKNLMQEAGIRSADRGGWPLITNGDALVAIPGIGVSVDWQCPPLEVGWIVEWQPVRDSPE